MHTVCVGTEGKELLTTKRGGVGSGHIGGSPATTWDQSGWDVVSV